MKQVRAAGPMHSAMLLCLTLTLPAAVSLSACSSNPSARPANDQVAELRTTVSELANAEGQTSLLRDFDSSDEISWTVFFPTTAPARPEPGLLVYISPSNNSGIPPKWLPVLEEENLILVSPKGAGNREPTTKRIALALSGLLYLNQQRNIDQSRIYISGFSGGARVSGLAVAQYPSLFRGAIYIGGAEMWPSQSSPNIAEQLRSTRFVFIAGSNDFNLDMARNVWGRYRSRGITHAKLEVIRHMGHELPGGSAMAEAISYLDEK